MTAFVRIQDLSHAEGAQNDTSEDLDQAEDGGSHPCQAVTLLPSDEQRDLLRPDWGPQKVLGLL